MIKMTKSYLELTFITSLHSIIRTIFPVPSPITDIYNYNLRQKCCDKIENSVFVPIRAQKVPFPLANVDRSFFLFP